MVIACVVNNTTADLEAKVIGSVGSTKSEQRCGRTVQVPVYKVIIQLRHPTEQTNETWTVQPPVGPPFSQPATSGGTFDRALSLATEGELQQVTLPDNGGSELLIGTTGDFHGSMLSINATGTATLKLRA